MMSDSRWLVEGKSGPKLFTPFPFRHVTFDSSVYSSVCSSNFVPVQSTLGYGFTHVHVIAFLRFACARSSKKMEREKFGFSTSPCVSGRTKRPPDSRSTCINSTQSCRHLSVRNGFSFCFYYALKDAAFLAADKSNFFTLLRCNMMRGGRPGQHFSFATPE
jgi:hypothetical protein